METKLDDLCNRTKMLETQVAQIASTTLRTPSKFPRKPEANPIEDYNTITLRSDKIMEELKKAINDPEPKNRIPNEEAPKEPPP